MKSIIYNYINRFWNGKSFLYRANAKKDMREIYEQDFSKPLKEYLLKSYEKSKEYCIECNAMIDSKEEVSIAFMNDMADDLARKRSAFWNCKVDAYICPLCAYLYTLVPLGFRLVGNKFVFQNIDSSIEVLVDVNKEVKIRDIVECKAIRAGFKRLEKSSFNRDIVECKVSRNWVRFKWV